LIAEYREILMVAGSLEGTLISKAGYKESKVLTRYTLNKGHVFYIKGLYLHKRYDAIIVEMKKRGFKPKSERIFPKNIFKEKGYIMTGFHKRMTIRKRIEEKIALKPDWYRISR
jgi:deoxyribonuclease (pyrimidine dimer)